MATPSRSRWSWLAEHSDAVPTGLAVCVGFAGAAAAFQLSTGLEGVCVDG